MNDTDIIQAAKRLYWTAKTDEEKTAILAEYKEEYRQEIKSKADAMERADNRGNEIFKQEHESFCPCSMSRFF